MPTRRLTAALRGLRRPAEAAPAPAALPEVDLEPWEQAIVDRALVDSITSRERVVALVDAVRYCVDREIEGAFAECGVWRGGSVIAMIMALQHMGVADRDIWLYDTFEGMTEPTEHDVSPIHKPALEIWREAEATGRPAFPEYFDPELFNEQVVRENVLSTGYPEARLQFVRGPVEQTIPGSAPERIALLRLDTDWYESTKHELEHLYPRLAEGGVLIIDDYGHWEGARRAVDEYFGAQAPRLLLNRIDYTGRVAIKH
jgi:O-methyltransferase